jgi:HNH endonuclease
MTIGSTDRQTAADRRRAAGEMCTYCGQARLDGRQGAEHPIPRVLGSRLTVFTVCDECNKEAASNVDAPWLRNVFVQAERAKFGVVDPRHKASPVKDPILNGAYTDEDGHRVVVQDGIPRYPGSIVHAGDTASIAADTPERARELLDRLRGQLAKDGQEIHDFSQKVRKEHRPRLSRDLSMRVAGIGRGQAVARVAVGRSTHERRGGTTCLAPWNGSGASIRRPSEPHRLFRSPLSGDSVDRPRLRHSRLRRAGGSRRPAACTGMANSTRRAT